MLPSNLSEDGLRYILNNNLPPNNLSGLLSVVHSNVQNNDPKQVNNNNTLSSSLHGMTTMSAYGFNEVAQEKLKQAPDRNESSSPLDEFSQFIESSIHPLPPGYSMGL